jgi:Uma2 family endonuclease
MGAGGGFTDAGDEYDQKFKRYAEMGVLYYTVYNPSHRRRDRADALEVYRLEQGVYVRENGNPVWMPEPIKVLPLMRGL